VARYRCAGCGSEFESDEPRCPSCHRKTTVQGADVAPRSVSVEPSRGPGRSPAERHWRANAILQTIFVGLHLLCLASVVLNLLLASWSGAPGNPFGTAFAPPQDSVEHGAFYATLGAIGVWSAVGLVWTPLNAWGLWKRRPWARTSTLVYWIGSLFTCCCVPFGAYGIWSLLREDVRDLAGSPAPFVGPAPG
jgi:DNA-directed RNA polymerase subunit RPC12/RpoP